jgi:hypothetical protein
VSNYCTTEQARSAGATGSDAEIAAAITAASTRVERYTSELFEPTALTLDLDVDSDGIARPRKRIQSVTSVTWYGAPAPIATTGYRVSSSTNGGRDEIALYGDLSWADVTVLGAEPWNGGWANLSRSRDPRVSVVGVFGWDAPPYDVVQATALIAAHIRDADVLTDSAEGGTTADAEGNVLPVVPPFSSNETTEKAVEREVQQLGLARARTTGVLAADSLLASYVREPVRFR